MKDNVRKMFSLLKDRTTTSLISGGRGVCGALPTPPTPFNGRKSFDANNILLVIPRIKLSTNMIIMLL